MEGGGVSEYACRVMKENEILTKESNARDKVDGNPMQVEAAA